MDPPPPPPPPHGQNPKSSGLPPGKYDIFIIPEHSAGSGFLYLPSLKPNVNSFAAGFASALILVVVGSALQPAVMAWWHSVKGAGGAGMIMLMLAVGVGAWALGRIQTDGGPGPGGGNRSSGGGGPSPNGNTHQNTHSNTQSNGYASGAPPGGMPGSGPMPGASANGGPKPQGSWQRPEAPPGAAGANSDSGAEGAARGAWEKAREETKRKEEERKARDAERKRKEELDKKIREMREREAREREKREAKQREDEQRAREAEEKAAQMRREAEARAAQMRREDEARAAHMRREDELKAREAEARAAQMRREDELKAKEAEARAAQMKADEARASKLKEEVAALEKKRLEEEARQRRMRELEALRAKRKRDEEAKAALAKAAEEKTAAEAKAKAAAAATAAAATEAAKPRGSTYAYSAVGEKTNPWPKGRPQTPPAVRPTPPPPRPAPPSPTKNPPPPTAKTYRGNDDDAHSYRPYDKPKPMHTKSPSSIYSESSYAASQSTSRTTPPPSRRGPYSTKDPNKIVIKAVYSFNNAFLKTPTSQLVSGVGSVTDGLILRITTEGLFIDDDVRGVPQREWDVKAWTMKLVEVWCPSFRQSPALASARAASTSASKNHNPVRRLWGLDKDKPATSEETDALLVNMLNLCKNNCRLRASSFASDRDSVVSDSAYGSSVGSSSPSVDERKRTNARGANQTGEVKMKQLHILRASIRDQEGKKYVFVIGEEESWKLAVGLQRLRKGSQVRALGVSGMSSSDAKGTLDNLGWI